MDATATNTLDAVTPADSISPQQLVSSLCNVPERSMRTHLLVEKLCMLEPETVAELLQGIITTAAEQRGDYCLALEALDVPSLTHKTCNSFMSFN